MDLNIFKAFPLRSLLPLSNTDSLCHTGAEHSWDFKSSQRNNCLKWHKNPKSKNKLSENQFLFLPDYFHCAQFWVLIRTVPLNDPTLSPRPFSSLNFLLIHLFTFSIFLCVSIHSFMCLKILNL